MDNIYAHDIYFVQKIYACGVVKLNSIQKCTCLHTAKLLMIAMSIAKLEKTQHLNVCDILWK
jgi:hypothetical protein